MSATMVPCLDGDSLVAAGGTKRTATWYDDAGKARQRTEIWLYNAIGSVLVPGAVYLLAYDGDGDTNPKLAACAALAVYQEVVVVVNATPIGAWDWFAFEGYVEASCNGATALTKDDYLKVVAGTDADAFVDNTTARTVNSHAIYSDDEGQPSSTANRLVYLFGKAAIIT